MHTHVCMHVYFCIMYIVYICICVYACVCIFVYMYVHIHACFLSVLSRVMKSTLAKPEVCVLLPKSSVSETSVFGSSRTSKGKGWSTERDMLAGRNNRCPHLERCVRWGM